MSADLFIYNGIAISTTGLMHHINLQYIPAGQAGMWQPLDAFIFGELKSRAVAVTEQWWNWALVVKEAWTSM